MNVSSHQHDAADPVNSSLNFAYSLVESEDRTVVNAIGLEPAVGFLHEPSATQTRESLVYDLMEPFRWIADLSVVNAFEAGALKLHDFYFTGDDYRYRFEPEAKDRFISTLRERVNAGVTYNGQVLKWDTVIERKTAELGRFLTGKAYGLDFGEPAPSLLRQDDSELRAKLLSLTSSEAKRLGIPKQSLHDLRMKSRSARSFKLYAGTRRKLSHTEIR